MVMSAAKSGHALARRASRYIRNIPLLRKELRYIYHICGTISLQYFQAVQEGKKRATQAQMKLFDAGGFAMLTQTTKKVSGKFLPVGEEEYSAVTMTDEGHVVVIVDGDGHTKAQSKATEQTEAAKTFQKLIQNGTEQFDGNEIILWSRVYPVVKL